VRPVLLRVMRPASDNTSRCFITAGKDIANGSASSLTDRSFSCDRRASNARRVGSDSAAKVRSSNVSLNLTMRLSIETRVRMSRTGACFLQSEQEEGREAVREAAKEAVKEAANQALKEAANGTLQKKIRGVSQIKPCNTPRQGGEQPTTRSSKTARSAAPPFRYSKTQKRKTQCGRIRSPNRRDRSRPARSRSRPSPRSACDTRRSPRDRSPASRSRA
jgi:hypothetical protein